VRSNGGSRNCALKAIREKITQKKKPSGGLKMKRMSTRANPAPNPSDEIMTVLTLAEFLRCNQSTIYRLLKRKQIPAFKLRSDWRFSRSAIDEWIARQYKTNSPVTKRRKSKVS
jgi:excisionase family DNA binding protein